MPDLKLVISAKVSSEETLLSILSHQPDAVEKRVKIISQTHGTPFLWTQDSSKTLDAGMILRPRHLVENQKIPSSRTFHSIELLESEMKIGVVKSLFSFDGGQIVVGAKHALVSPSVVSLARSEFKLTHDEALQALRAEFGKDVLEVGLTENGKMGNIAFHQDVTLAVVRDRITGKEVILNTSLRESLRLIVGEEAKNGSAVTWSHFQNVLAKKVDQFGNRCLEHPDCVMLKKLSQLTDHDVERALRSEFEVETTLKAKGYAVKRIPGFLTDGESQSPQFYSYSNAVFSGENALVGELGVPVFDQAAAFAVRAKPIESEILFAKFYGLS